MLNCILTSSLIDTTILAAIIAAGVSYFVAQYTYKGSEFQRLDNMLFQLNSLAMRYPKLEDETFIKSLNKNYTSSEDGMRYETYCIMWFNLLENIYNFYDGDKKKIENFIHVSEIVRLHSDCWVTPTGNYANIDGYKPGFKNFINQYIK